MVLYTRTQNTGMIGPPPRKELGATDDSLMIIRIIRIPYG
jgi:hypothetical protein